MVSDSCSQLWTFRSESFKRNLLRWHFDFQGLTRIHFIIHWQYRLVYNKFYTHHKIGYARKEDIPEEDFLNPFRQWLNEYIRTNRHPPGTIIVYRQGLSIPQIKQQVEKEVQALHKAIDQVRIRLKEPSYMPQIAYLVFNTKISSRFYDLTRNFISNPTPGTVVFDQFESEGVYDFYITPQKVTQGTSTSVHCIVAYSSRDFPQQQLAQFTYEQCFGYYNWSGAVKLPAPLQNANKLSKFVGQAIKNDSVAKQLKTSYCYL